MTEHTALRFEQHLLDEWGKSFHDFSVFGCDEYGCQYADHEVNRLWLIWIHRQKEVDRLVEALRMCATQIDDERPTSRCMDNIVSDTAWKLITEIDGENK